MVKDNLRGLTVITAAHRSRGGNAKKRNRARAAKRRKQDKHSKRNKRESGRDKSYDDSFTGKGATAIKNSSPDGIHRRSMKERVCELCGAELTVGELNAHWKAHQDNA